jgi:hypothetical protein
MDEDDHNEPSPEDAAKPDDTQVADGNANTITDDQAALFPVVDALFWKSDKAHATVKNFCEALEQLLAMKLSKESKTVVKARVVDLVCGRIYIEKNSIEPNQQPPDSSES